MELRPLGSTGLKVTPIGLGLAAVGRPGYITLDREKDLGSDRSVASLERRSHDVLGAAFYAGIRYFDAARSYGFAERFLASWFRERALPPNAVTVGSKWGYTYVGDWQVDARVHEVKDHSLAALRRQIEESRALLGEYLDLYQIHSATLESGVLDDEAVLAELNSLRASGLTIGMSVSGPRQAEVIRRALAEAHAAGWGVIIKEALANGRLADRDQEAIAAGLANPWVDVVLSGAVTEAQVRSNVRALALHLSPAELAALSKLAEPADQYWKERGQLAWH